MTVRAQVERLSVALSGRYRIERELGAGGMATVHLAHDVRHDRDVAKETASALDDAHPAMVRESEEHGLKLVVLVNWMNQRRASRSAAERK